MLFRILLFILLGFIMQFKPALWIVLIAAIFNFLADMAGQYENGLYIPISLRIITDEDRQEFMGFSQSIGLAAHIFFQSSGAILITWMSFSHLAFFNAITFLVTFLIITVNKSRIQEHFMEKPLNLAETESDQSVLKTIKNTLWTAISELKKIPDIHANMVVILILNGLTSSLSILLTLMMNQIPSFTLINPATTLATVNITIMVGSILGGILTMNVLKVVSIQKTIQASTLLTCLMLIAFAFGNIYLMLLFLLPLGVLSGALNPKFNTLIYNTLPEESLATIMGGITTYFQLGMVIMQVTLSGLVLVFSAKLLVVFLLLLSLLTLGYTMKKR
ncbi:MFS transporter [Streptococcus sp. 20-1249]|uniref:MFS transporter n=1 Tax=Streptococcus hepaticus TaxID=3349163 RepID=UPI0037496065